MVADEYSKTFFLFAIERREKVKPDIIPIKTPFEIFETSSVGTIKKMPERIIITIRISDFFMVLLRKKDSRKIVKTGNVEKERSPMATVEI